MDDIEVTDRVTIPGWETWMTTSRSGGPGGQHANKTSSKVTLYWDLAGTTALTDAQRNRVRQRLSSHLNDDGSIQVTCDETRSQHNNRKIAQERLGEMVRKAMKPRKRRKKTRAPRWVDRQRVREKRRRGRVKELRKDPKEPLD